MKNKIMLTVMGALFVSTTVLIFAVENSQTRCELECFKKLNNCKADCSSNDKICKTKCDERYPCKNSCSPTSSAPRYTVFKKISA